MREKFIEKDFKPETMEVIDLCNEIMEEYAEDELDLTVRQLYYQLVARDVIPNTQRSYSRIGSIVADARLAGLMDWDMIVDRVRETIHAPHWNSPAEILEAVESQFRIDKWRPQPYYVHVMCEKQAGEGVLAPICRQLDVPFTANRGYSSISFMYRLARDINLQMLRGKRVLILYCGDHDPSGLDMDRDIDERLRLLTKRTDDDSFDKGRLLVRRVALTMEQIEEFKPPPNPAKVTDSRAKTYIERFGRVSWELDALNPRVLRELIEEEVELARDDDVWGEEVAREEAMRVELAAVREGFEGREW